MEFIFSFGNIKCLGKGNCVCITWFEWYFYVNVEAEKNVLCKM